MTREEIFKKVLDCSFKVHSSLDPDYLKVHTENVYSLILGRLDFW
jgi:hypothetical protein